MCPASLSDSQTRGCPSLSYWSRIDLSPTYRPVVNSSAAVTAPWPPSAAARPCSSSDCSSLVQCRSRVGRVQCLSRNGWTWWNVGLGCTRSGLCCHAARAQWITWITTSCLPAATAAANQQVTVKTDLFANYMHRFPLILKITCVWWG